MLSKTMHPTATYHVYILSKLCVQWRDGWNAAQWGGLPVAACFFANEKGIQFGQMEHPRGPAVDEEMRPGKRYLAVGQLNSNRRSCQSEAAPVRGRASRGEGRTADAAPRITAGNDGWVSYQCDGFDSHSILSRNKMFPLLKSPLLSDKCRSPTGPKLKIVKKSAAVALFYHHTMEWTF